MDERIICNKCGKKCTPRLWHLKGGFFRRKRIQHICPYCGSVMYHTGGGVGLGIIGLGVFLIVNIAFAMIQIANKDVTYKQQLKAEIEEITNRIQKYENDIYNLQEKTKSGKNPQLLKQLEGKPEKLQSLKALLNEKKSALESTNGS